MSKNPDWTPLFLHLEKDDNGEYSISRTLSADNEYVCWIDIMGTKRKMGNSVYTSAVFILKLHAALIDAINNMRIHIKVYPVMDGAYITSKSSADLTSFLDCVLSALAHDFVVARHFQHKFLTRASIAYGPIIHGADIPNSVHSAFGTNSNYKDSLLFGLPMIQANESEKNAPAFGVFIHESARVFAPYGPSPFPFKWWTWLKSSKYASENVKKCLYRQVKEYFDECAKYINLLDYAEDKRKQHAAIAEEYFTL